MEKIAIDALKAHASREHILMYQEQRRAIMDTSDDAYGPDEKQERLRHVETMLEAVLMQLAQEVFDALDEHG